MNFIKFVSFFFFLRSHIIWILELKPKVISNLELELTSFENKQKEQCALYMWKPKLELQLFLCMKRLASTPWQRMHTLNFYTKMQWLKIAVGHRKDVLWQKEKKWLHIWYIIFFKMKYLTWIFYWIFLWSLKPKIWWPNLVAYPQTLSYYRKGITMLK